jgi:glycerophosphoryl diester phosphodiesterase
MVIGHGGSGFSDKAVFPPNSWQSAVNAVEQLQADGVEIDIQMSRDSVAFMYHDESLEGLSFCHGCFFTYEAAALRQCRFKPMEGRKANERLTPVEQLIARFAGRSVKPLVFLDLKLSSGCLTTREERRDYAYALMQSLDVIIRKYHAEEWVILQSDSRQLLAYGRREFPHLRLILDYIQNEGDIEYAASEGLYGVAAPMQDLSGREIRTAQARGLKVQLYGARLQPDIAAALDFAPDFFLADNIPLTQQMLR